MQIAVLGAGMVGRAIATDLATSHQVTAMDSSTHNLSLLNQHIKTQPFDFTEWGNYASMLKKFELVVTAVPGFLGYRVLEQVILNGKNVVDISFSPEDTLQLDALAKEKNVTAIVDCGVAPGMSNLVLGRYNEEMKVTHFECYVGGLPVVRKKPFEYKAPFSPVDVIEEYTRPARLMEKGQIVTKPALSENEQMDFDGIGTLEAFNTDGLRSLLFTMGHIPDMKEKTLRYPGHVDLIKALQQSGFFSEELIEVNGQKISPLSLNSKILFKEWFLGPDEKELTVMKIAVHGETKNRLQTVTYSLLDYYDEKTQTSSMARTTGYTCTAAVELIYKKLFTSPGVFPPELVGSNQPCFESMLRYLNDRNVKWIKEVS